MATERPKIYHITHVDNLPQIIGSGGLVSDAVMAAKGGPRATIGMARIKERRLTLPVSVHRGTSVGDYVPFYFCPRSIMLYLIHRRNHELAYRGGQTPIVHLECDLQDCVDRALSESRRWAFTSSNAGAYYADFYNELRQLDELNWPAIDASDWRDPLIKEGKQAEFLYHGQFPWTLVERIGVQTAATLNRVEGCLTASPHHQPRLTITRGWYY